MCYWQKNQRALLFRSARILKYIFPFSVCVCIDADWEREKKTSNNRQRKRYVCVLTHRAREYPLIFVKKKILLFNRAAGGRNNIKTVIKELLPLQKNFNKKKKRNGLLERVWMIISSSRSCWNSKSIWWLGAATTTTTNGSFTHPARGRREANRISRSTGSGRSRQQQEQHRPMRAAILAASYIFSCLCNFSSSSFHSLLQRRLLLFPLLAVRKWWLSGTRK